MDNPSVCSALRYLSRVLSVFSVPDEEEAELESQYVSDAFAGVHPDDMERVRGEYKAGYETEHFTVKKYRLRRRDGSYVWVNADLRLQACTPDYKLFYATYIDVTEEHEMQMQLSEALERQKAHPGFEFKQQVESPGSPSMQTEGD